jgi:predicted Ser/Thr protein kinase
MEEKYDISKLQIIGQGRQGRAYLLPDHKVLKVFRSSDSCRSQLETLQKAKNSRFFPTVFDYDKYFILMSFVYGSNLHDYLKLNKLDKPLSLELVKVIEEFKSLAFTRLDVRLGHIFVQADKTVKIIDPRGSFVIVQPYPLLMMRGLKRLGALETFLNFIKEDYPDYYNYWKDNTPKKS